MTHSFRPIDSENFSPPVVSWLNLVLEVRTTSTENLQTLSELFEAIPEQARQDPRLRNIVSALQARDLDSLRDAQLALSSFPQFVRSESPEQRTHLRSPSSLRASPPEEIPEENKTPFSLERSSE